MILIHKEGIASSSLDLVRFIAALAVILGHGVSRFFGPYDSANNAGIFEKLFRVAFSGYGSHGVTIFFILSGLFIGYSVINQIKTNSFSWKSYLSRRIIRLWIVLLPALVLTFILDYVGLKYFYEDAIYSGGNMIGAINGNNSSALDFIGNVFFVQTIMVPPFGTNGALWSLANEFWYYVLFPLCLFAFIKRNHFPSLIFFISLCVLVCLMVGSNIYIYFSIWLIGVLAIFIPSNNILRFKNAIFWSLIGLIISLICLRIAPVFEDKIIERLLVSIPFLIFVLTLTSNDKPILSKVRYLRISKSLAGFSYTLYLIHLPILCLIRGAVMGDNSFWAFNFENVFFFMLIISFIILVSYLFSLVTEAHTNKLYKALKV